MDGAATYGELLETKKMYIDAITELVSKSHQCSPLNIFSRRKPLNIAVIGPMGTGKSSFINSVFAAFTYDRWRMYAISGPTSGLLPITVHNTLYTNLNDMREFRDFEMPHIIDVAGFPDENSEKWFEVLQIIFGGRLPPTETINSAAQYYDSLFDGSNRVYVMSKMRKRYNKVDKRRVIDRIIFIGSYTEEPRYNLITCVKRAAEYSGRLSDSPRPSIPIFGVLTKRDLSISQEWSNEREVNFKLSLGIENTMFLSCSNYCDDMDRKLGFDRTRTIHPRLDVPFLRFMTQVCDPLIKVQHEHLRRAPLRRSPLRMMRSNSASPDTTIAILLFVGFIFLIKFVIEQFILQLNGIIKSTTHD